MGEDALVTKKMMSESGMFYVGDWCYTDLEQPTIEELGNRLLICDTGIDGGYDVTITIEEAE